MPVTHSGVTTNLEEDRKIRRVAGNLPLPSALKKGLKRVTSRADSPVRLRTLYLGLIDEYIENDLKVRSILQNMDAANRLEAIYVLTKVSRESVYPFDFVDGAIRPLGFEHVSSDAYPGTDVRGDIYRRTAVPAPAAEP